MNGPQTRGDARVGCGKPAFPDRVRAVLGPTNTGKTHLAIERLLAHSSGIIGFPLRLLARENYDRMVARKGVRNVALITGEEKILPPDARWFACTVEAMPLDRHVEFVAVDEIQLCADPDRGHIFTDRLLHARGMVETMFLGAETIRPLLRRLVPRAEIETRPRLSQLTYEGPAKLTRLPPRSAVVAFSAGEVYAIAELIRRRRGGCAVVMGRLSPRTRNAQVALYQEKEVDFLVATDAIGMGLNMDVDHVAFARQSKFDGHRPRLLTAAEVAQIAGRAGRGMRDGTFGTTAQCRPLDDALVQAVESHSFLPLEQLVWRNGDLDFSSVDALLGSLTVAPPRPGLVRGNDATDLDTLMTLSRDAEIRASAQGRAATRLLWDSCQIPDFRKLADDTHSRLCARVFFHLVRDGTLPTDWLAGQMAALTRPEGDIDTLMQRLSGMRVWSYVAARTSWVRDAAHWQNVAREVEEKLSDALHERLTARFVDRRATHLLRRLEAPQDEELLAAVTARGEVIVEGHPVGHVEGFFFRPDPIAEGEERRLVMRAARRALRQEMPRRVAMLATAPDDAFALSGLGIAWNGVVVAQLQPGPRLTRPMVHVLDSEFLDNTQRARVQARLLAWLDALVARDLAPLFAAQAQAETMPALRGPLHILSEAGGVTAAPGSDRAGQDRISPDLSLDSLRGALKQCGVVAGRLALFIPPLLKPRAMALRAVLWAVHHRERLPGLPAPGLVSLVPPDDWPPGFAEAMGWTPAGPVLVRLDVAERIAAELGWLTRRGAYPLPVNLASRLSIRTELLPPVLRALGMRLLPDAAQAPEMIGPPPPPMLIALRRRRAGGAAERPGQRRAPSMMPPHPVADGPFAALAALRR